MMGFLLCQNFAILRIINFYTSAINILGAIYSPLLSKRCQQPSEIH